MKLQGDLKSLTIRSIIWFSVILLVCLNFEYIVTQALEGAVWYQIPLVAIIVVLGIRLNIESENDAYSSIEMALILVVFISSWILFGVIHGFNSFSFHILHPMLVLLAYYVRKPSLGNWVFSIGNVTAIFAYQLRDINIYSIMLYMFILLGVFIHLAHVQMIMTSKRKLHKKVDELETLYAITKVLDSFPDLESVLQQITRIVTYGIGVDVCAVMLYSQETGKLELQARYPNNASKYSISRNRVLQVKCLEQDNQ